MFPRTSLPKRAFTLIELLLVMVILVVLAGIATPIYLNRAKDSKLQAASVAISNIEQCLDTFEVDCGRLPTSSEGLAALLIAPPNVQGWKGPYLKLDPLDPWKNPFVYRCPGQHNTATYDLSSNGPDGQEATADDIGNWKQE